MPYTSLKLPWSCGMSTSSSSTTYSRGIEASTNDREIETVSPSRNCICVAPRSDRGPREGTRPHALTATLSRDMMGFSWGSHIESQRRGAAVARACSRGNCFWRGIRWRAHSRAANVVYRLANTARPCGHSARHATRRGTGRKGRRASRSDVVRTVEGTESRG